MQIRVYEYIAVAAASSTSRLSKALSSAFLSIYLYAFMQNAHQDMQIKT